MTASPNAVEVRDVSHRYGERLALDRVSLTIDEGEIFAFLGPNGGGKTTLFRLASTLVPLQQGAIQVLGYDVLRQRTAARARLGVVFQSASLDKKLTVSENLRCQGSLYGVGGKTLREREGELLDRFGLSDRSRDRVENLSGGLRRRVELAKSMLHRPRLLLLDEPSAGLDPGARGDLWRYLEEIRRQDGVTVVLTTHLLEEAARADRLAILNQGSLVALDTPDNLRASVGGGSLTITTQEPESLAASLKDAFGCPTTIVDGAVRIEQADGHLLVSRIYESFAGRIQSITVSEPSLEDVFIARTGHRFWPERQEAALG